MPLLGWILLFAVGDSLGALTLAASVLLLPEAKRTALVPHLLSYATGILLGATFLGLLPHALEGANAEAVLGVTLVGVIVFFFLEKAVLWHHCSESGHTHVQDDHGTAAAGPLVLIGDAVHELTDGMVIAVAFAAGMGVGLSAALAVLMHAIPHKVGDFAILLESGFDRRRAYLWSAVASLPAAPAAAATYFWLGRMQGAAPYVMALAAASFLYIALADLTPSLHRHTSQTVIVSQAILLLLGAGTVAAVHGLLP